MSTEKVLTVRVSLKGRPLKTYRFTKDEVTVGRSPDCDVFLDNPGVSRSHARFHRTETGLYEVIDEGSANGTLVNETPIQKGTLLQDDVIQVGKFTLWIGYVSDLREQAAKSGTNASPDAYQGTTVLSTKELDGMLARARATRVEPEAAPEPEAPRVIPHPAAATAAPSSRLARYPLPVLLVGAFGLGMIAGASLLWLALR